MNHSLLKDMLESFRELRVHECAHAQERETSESGFWNWFIAGPSVAGAAEGTGGWPLIMWWEDVTSPLPFQIEFGKTSRMPV